MVHVVSHHPVKPVLLFWCLCVYVCVHVYTHALAKSEMLQGEKLLPPQLCEEAYIFHPVAVFDGRRAVDVILHVCLILTLPIGQFWGVILGVFPCIYT